MSDEKFFDTKYGLKLSELNLENKPVYPDYDDSIVNLSNSIMEYYGAKTENKTLPIADMLLNKNKKKHVVVILLDGLGMNILESCLYYKDFLRRNLVCDYSSVFPPTTVASTTSFLSGKYPVEHGWLGWDLYFEKEDKSVTCFTNNLQGTETPAADYNVPQKYLPYENIIEKINNTGNAKAYAVYPFGPEAHSDLNDWVETIRKHCHKDERNFVYAYWEDPDYLLHRLGTKALDVARTVQELNEKIVYLCDTCPDTTFFVTADHGHLDISNEILTEEYPALTEMLVRKPSLEKRALSFYVKPEYMEKFPVEFVKLFGTDYVLFTKDEVMEKHLFGNGAPHENLTGIGDYVAVSFTNKTLVWDKNDNLFRSHHAGMNSKEMRIPLICYENKPRHVWKFVYYGVIALVIAFIAMILF